MFNVKRYHKLFS